MDTAATRKRRPPSTRRRATLSIAAIVAVLGLAGPTLGSSITIQAKNFEFLVPGGGSSLTVTAGAQVTWVASGDPHTVTSGAPGAVDNRFADQPASVGFLTAGAPFSTTFSAPGTYPYFCEVHPEQMSGVVTVLATSTNPPTPTPTPTKAPTARPSKTPASPSASPPIASPISSPTAVPGASQPGPGVGIGSARPLPASPSPPASVEAVPTPSATATAAGGYGGVDPVGDGTASSGAPMTVLAAALTVVALAALGVLAFRRRNRGS